MLKKNKININIFLFSLIIYFLIMEVCFFQKTELSPGNYGRYLEIIWSENIKQNFFIMNNPFPKEPSLFSNANSYHFNLIPALHMVIINLVTDIEMLKLQMLPLYGFCYALSVIVLASSLYSKKKIAIIISLILCCFFVYPVNSISREINRIILSYFILFFFLYSYFEYTKRNDARFVLLTVFFLVFFIFTYSSNAVTAIIFIFSLCLINSYIFRKISFLNLGIIYLSICLLYYLIKTDFLNSGILGFKEVIETKGISLNFNMFKNPGIWPGENVYVPHYTEMDWFFLIYPFSILTVLLIIALYLRLVSIKKLHIISNYDKMFFSFIVYFIFAVIFNSVALFYTAGLDYISLFSWFAPILSVYSILNYLKGSAYFRNLKLVLLVFIILLGTYSIYSYGRLEPRKAECVSKNEIAICNWLYDKNLRVTSDFHFISTYVTLNGINAHHFLPMEKKFIKELYYQLKDEVLKTNNVDAYVVTSNMKNDYIMHFMGIRTVKNFNMDEILGWYYKKTYDSNQGEVFCVKL